MRAFKYWLIFFECGVDFEYFSYFTDCCCWFWSTCASPKITSRIDLLHKTTFITTTSTNWYMFRVDDDRCQWYWSTGGIKNFHLSFSLFLNKFFTSHSDQKFRKCLSTFLDFLSQCTFIFLFLQSHTLIPLGLL